ncbi:16S rRNA (cytidine(1402)-2'-O)-methyltransferase [Undibacterium cyanobacteriorum]|uniref:Ribosomal RNA small subunit methyltransferase I n=1 Tax=Undibacterium cyanobacteriorum TaxID=3073561 RepID=A0ABY9RIP6_9BURK|nr:16S rRNA (cytidine(1402)-2'-O)-methyltransferase [Undibacterium sp. 20NA77.5]WMW81097.1 16S rRNA (cytidine(1402)-2'-O)-methyltransferase [Undibacterium sp. 20NA77.5]
MNTESTSFPIHTLLEAAQQQTYPNATLYIIATPIGNSADISLRALHVLSLVDAVACEDTRTTAQLLTRYGLHKQLLAAHMHNEHEAAEKIIARLQAGERIALVSDAGTPGVSDPGAIIVDAVRKAGFRISPLPGASAAISALSASGLVNDHFYFHGFLPSKAGQRDSVLQSLKSLTATLVFYEAPHRILETTKALQQQFGDQRHIVFAREISKLFEEIHRCELGQASAWLESNQHGEKGEYVVLVEGARSDSNAEMQEARRVLEILINELSVKQASQLAALITGQKKNALYELALAMKNADQAD